MTVSADSLTLFNANVIFRMIPFVDIEGGGALVGALAQGYGRIGLRVPVGNWRNADARGWSLNVGALGGARYRRAYFSDAVSVTAVAAFDASYFFAEHFGLTTRLVCGADVAVHSPTASVEGPLTGTSLELSLGVGVSF